MIRVAVLNPSGVSHTPDILTQGGGRAGIRLSPGEGDVATHTHTHTHTHTSFALVTAMHGTGQPFPAGTSPLSQKGALQEVAWCKLKHKHPFSIMTGDYLQKGINTQFFLKIHASPSGKDKVIQTLARSLLRLRLPPAPHTVFPFSRGSCAHRACKELSGSKPRASAGSEESHSRLIFRGT